MRLRKAQDRLEEQERLTVLACLELGAAAVAARGDDPQPLLDLRDKFLPGHEESVAERARHLRSVHDETGYDPHAA